MQKWIGVVLLALLAVACSKTQSGQHKTTDVQDLLYVSASGEARVDIYVDLGGLITSTDADTSAGDAPATNEVKIPISAALKGAQAGASTEGSSTVEGDPVNIEPIDASNRPVNTTNPAPVPVPVTPPTPGEDDADDPGSIVGVDTILYTFPCEGKMSYRDCEMSEPGCESVDQVTCFFTEFASCEDIPVESFTVMWKDPTGNERTLAVPNKCTSAMDSKENGYGKYRYIHDKEPLLPVAYAPRGFNASEVNIIGKKSGEAADCTFEWKGKDPDPKYDRAWWSKTSGDPAPWVRQFEIPYECLPKDTAIKFVFSDGHEGVLSDAYDGNKYIVPGTQIKYVEGIPNHSYMYDRLSDIACAEGSKCEWVKLYYQ